MFDSSFRAVGFVDRNYSDWPFFLYHYFYLVFFRFFFSIANEKVMLLS